MADFGARIRSMTPRYKQALFKDVSFSWANPLNDTPTMSFEFSYTRSDDWMAGFRRDMLNDDVVVELYWDKSWHEVANARFVPLVENIDLIQDPIKVQYQCQGVCWSLGGMLCETGGPGCTLNEKGEITWPANISPGQYIKGYFQDGWAQAGGRVTTNTGNIYDSFGVRWSDLFTMKTKTNLNLRQLIESLTTQGFLDWRFQGDQLQACQPEEAMQRDRTNVWLMPGREVSAAPITRTWADYYDRVRVRGDDELLLDTQTQTSVHYRGLRAMEVSQSGVTDQVTANTLAQTVLNKVARGRTQYTLELDIGSHNAFLPYKHYDVGDMVMAQNWIGRFEPMRIHQITLSSDGSKLTGNVILHDRFLEKQVKDSRKIMSAIGLTGGNSATYV